MTDIKCVHVPFLLESATELASKEQTEDKLATVDLFPVSEGFIF